MSSLTLTLLGIAILLLGVWIIWRFAPGALADLGLLLAFIGWVLMVIGASSAASARDLGQWEGGDPAIRAWYQALMQPDVPAASCCGEADAYWCDDIHVRDGKAFCAITDDREDAPRGRPHREFGAQYEIPPNKLKWDKSNPTGHSIIFLSRQDYVFCFVQASGA